MSDENPYQLSVDQVQTLLPHRHPFLLIDRVLNIQTVGEVNSVLDSSKVGTKVTAIKAIAFNEPWFQGHFPGFAIMPGVLLVEAMAQAASFSIYPYIADDVGRVARNFECILVGVDKARFRKPVVPGDLLKLETEVIKVRGPLWGFQCTGFVDGQKVVEAELLASLKAGEKIDPKQMERKSK